MKRQFRMFFNRVINFVRPKPRYMPLTVEQVLQSKEGLDTVNRFNDLYYSGGIGKTLNWRGSEMIKNPCDLWMIVELMQKLQPTVILETGTHHGASATFFADMAKTLSIPCTVITIDINPKWNFNPETKNILSLVGYSVDPSIVQKVEKVIQEKTSQHPGSVIVMLDSDHSRENVSKELELYHRFVTRNSYLIVEDTNVNGHPSAPSHGPGPWEAVDLFLKQYPEFSPDRECERFLLTYNPRGWLKRLS